MERKQYKFRIVETKEVDPKTIVLNPNNPREHPENQRKAMDSVLKNIGWVNYVVVNKNTGNLIDGEMRVLDAIANHEETVPVTFVDLTPEEELQILATYDPIGYMAKESSEMFKKLITEHNVANETTNEIINDIVKRNRVSLFGESETQENDAETIEDKNKALIDKWGVEYGQIWKINQHRLMCGNATNVEDVSRLMDGKKASCGFFDPPYGIEYQSNKRVKSGKFEELENDDEINVDFLFAILNHLKKDFALYICTRWDVYPQWYEQINSIVPIKNIIIWDKPGGGIGDLKGNYWNQHEFILYCALDNHVLRGVREGNVWNFGGKNVASYLHPTQKPVGLPAKCFEHSSDIGDIVVDLYIGSGTSIISAQNTNRICYGMELTPKYVAVTLERMKELGIEPERIE